MTARRSSAGRCRTAGLRCRACWPRRSRRFCGERVTVSGAGRTDAGVHALGQVAHVDLAKDWDADTVRDAINAHLRPHPVAVLAAETVPDDFDARFSAVRRHYLYRIVNRRADLALERGRAWRVPRPLDDAAMQAAAQRLVGNHDFTTFRAAECQAKSPVKTLDRLDVTRAGDEIGIEAAARSFLHTQVRSMVGALVAVGDGRWSGDDLAAALASARPHRLRAGGAAGGAVSGARGLLSDVTLDRNTDRGFSGRPRSALQDRRPATRSSTWCMVWPTRPNSSTGQ